MKYKLLKDLPFANAGAIIDLFFSEDTIKGYDVITTDNNRLEFTGLEDKDLDMLLKDGWIREVREPRESYVRIDHIVSSEDIAQGHWDKDKFILMREVIEN